MAFLKSANRLIREGVEQLQRREFEKALWSFQHAEKKRRDDPDVLNYISQAYAGLEQLDKAIEEILKAITLDPEATIHRQLYATYLMRQNRHHEAIPIIDEVLETQPADMIYVLRGQADYHLGNFDSAKEFFQKALELDERNPLANHMIGLVYYRMKQYSMAIPYLETALTFGEIESLREILADCKARTAL